MQRYWRMRRNRKREELYKKMVQLYENCRKDGIWQAIRIQGQKSRWRIRRVEINNITRLICADPVVNRDTCAPRLKNM